jgi:hypothetical protein
MASNKPQIVKAAVVSKATMGDSISQIARDLEISRPTVMRILSESEFHTLIASGKSRLYEMIPEAVEKYGQKIKSDPLEAKDFLERVTVLPAKQDRPSINATQINFGSLAIPHAGSRSSNLPNSEAARIPAGDSGL